MDTIVYQVIQSRTTYKRCTDGADRRRRAGNNGSSNDDPNGGANDNQTAASITDPNNDPHPGIQERQADERRG